MQKVTVTRPFRLVDPPKGLARKLYVVGEDVNVSDSTREFMAENGLIGKAPGKPKPTQQPRRQARP